MTEADAPAFGAHVAADLARLSEFLPWPAVTNTAEGAAAWIGRYVDGEAGRELCAGIFVDGVLSGGVVLFQHSPEQAVAELGCWAVAAAEGRGLVRAACREAIRLAHALGVQRLEWHCDPRNTRSGALALRLGFRHEGTLRSSYLLRGRRLDTDVYSLIESEIPAALG